MPTARSVAEVEELKELLGEATVIISTDFRGLNVAQMSALRRAISDGGAKYRVAKNTLIRIASTEVDRPEIGEILAGPTGFVVGVDDPVRPAKALIKFITDNRLEVAVNGAYLDGQVVDGDRVKYLATLPGREELVARLLGQMNAPVANLVAVLSGTIRGLLTVLQAHIDQGGNAALAEPAAALVAAEPAGSSAVDEDGQEEAAATAEPEGRDAAAEEPDGEVTGEEEAGEEKPA